MKKLILNSLLFRPTPISRKTSAEVFAQNIKFYSSQKCSGAKCQRPVRGRLPWEIDYYQKCLQEKMTEFPCKDCKPPALIHKLTMTECELRRLENCMRIYKNQEMCRHLGLNLMNSKKTYPMRHAVEKKYLPGCPVPGWLSLYNKPCGENC